MKKLSKSIACMALSVSGLIFVGETFASGNGGGNEPPPKKDIKGEALACTSSIPFYCFIQSLSGNGGGNEPPKKGR